MIENDRKECSNHDIEKIGKKDHLRNLILVVLNSMPIVGGTVSILFDKYIPEKRLERLHIFLKSLKSDIEKLKLSFTEELIASEEFIEIIENVFYGVAKTSQREKIECYKAILLNSIKFPANPSFEIKELYIKMIDELSTAHIKVISVLYNNSQDGVVSDAKESERRLQEYSPDVLRLISRDLESKGLLESSEKWARFAGEMKGWDYEKRDKGLPVPLNLTKACKDFIEYINIS